ncbi:MAG: CoA-binding protein [Deltaproteobacteria bacterium]|nr:CoA-binding protein [Deltaproteobacteria bacterium]
MDSKIEKFLAAKAFGVVGASTNREKYGNKVLRCYLQSGRKAVPVNPKEKVVEGLAAVAEVKDLPAEVEAISIITPPAVTEQVVEAAIARGIKHIWMQPGAESEWAVSYAEAAGLNVIGDGSCLLVALGYSEHG